MSSGDLGLLADADWHQQISSRKKRHTQPPKSRQRQVSRPALAPRSAGRNYKKEQHQASLELLYQGGGGGSARATYRSNPPRGSGKEGGEDNGRGGPAWKPAALKIDEENAAVCPDISESLEEIRREMFEEEDLERGEDLSYLIKSLMTAAHDVAVYGLTEFGLSSHDNSSFHAKNQFLSFDGKKTEGDGSGEPSALQLLDMLQHGYYVRMCTAFADPEEHPLWIGLGLLNHCSGECIESMKREGETRLTKRLWLVNVVVQALRQCDLPENKPGKWPSYVQRKASKM